MKILTHSFDGLKNSRHDFNRYSSDPHPAYKKASGGEDFLNISPEAEKKFHEAEIISLAEFRAGKGITDGFSGDSGEARAAKIKKQIADGVYNFDSEKIVSETAELLVGFMFSS